MSHVVHNSERPWDKLVWGVVLIGLGTYFLLSMLGFIPSYLLRTWWPLIVIAVGLGTLLSARDPRAIGSAVTTMSIGGWMLVASNAWFGLSWSRSWPLALVAAGLGSLTDALAQSVWPRKENDHVA